MSNYVGSFRGWKIYFYSNKEGFYGRKGTKWLKEFTSLEGLKRYINYLEAKK